MLTQSQTASKRSQSDRRPWAGMQALSFGVGVTGAVSAWWTLEQEGVGFATEWMGRELRHRGDLPS